MMNGTEYDADPAAQLFDQFISAVTCKSILGTFHDLCDSLGLTNTDHRNFYKQLKSKLTSWKAKSLWTKLDKRASHRDYRKMEACPNTKVLIIGAGPCGMRMAIEVALMGGKAVVVEKRDRFSRNNVLHLWNYLISDLKNLGAKKFFGKFCAGSIEHISIRQLQCILMKVALLLGVEVHVNVAFEELIEPPEDQSSPMGWRCRVTPSNHPVSEYQFDVLIGADGKRNTVPGFKRKEFRGKLAIAITANFINRNSNAEARVEEISGVAFIFNQKFFLDLKEKTSIDLENIVYYKDETHYFVMTAKKASLLEKGVLKEDYNDTVQLLSRENVDQDALLTYAKEAADFSTNHQLPCLDYAVNHYGQADIAMFDFTSMFAAENACRALERHGHKLAIAIVGDSLLEPFWPTGSGCARGFLGVFDAAWMIKSWASGKMSPLEVIAERESIYQLLSQTTPENLHKNHGQYSIDPNTRYPNLNLKNRLKLAQVKHLYDGPLDNLLIEEAVDDAGPAKRSRICGTTVNNDLIDSYSLLRWCQRVLNTGRFRNVHVVDFAGSWRNGLAFCALIHAFRPTLLDFNLLMESDVAKNNQLAFDVAEKDLGVPPVMTGEDMAKSQIPDKLTLVSYISQLYAIFRKEPLPTVDANLIFCQQTGCYVRKAEPEDGEVSTIKVEDNPFYGVRLAAVRTNNQSTPAMLRSDSQLSYDRPGIPDWVRYAASQASASEGSSVSETDSDSTTADGSITVWKKRGRRRTCSSGNSDDEVKRPADKIFVKDWVKTSSRRWSDSSDHTSTDDEQDRPISVKALAKFYDGPRGYSVSHRPRSKKVSAKREVKPECVETSSDVLANLSETQIGNGAVILDDSAFKTFTQDDMDQSNPQFTMDGTVLTGDDLFRTLTQGDDLKVRADDDPSDPAPFPLKEAKPGDIRTEEDVREAKTESAVQSLDIDLLKEECSGDDKTLERQVDVDMQEAKIDSDPATLASPWDDSSCKEECSGEILALTKEATSDVDMRETRTDCDPSNVASLPGVNLPKEENVEARTKSSENEKMAAVDMKGGMRRFAGDDSAPPEDEEDADVDSSDEETVVPLDFKSLKKKFSGDASRTPEETLRGKRRAKSGSQQPDVRRQVKSVVPRYRHSYTGGKVPLPGPASSSESSTDEAIDMASAKEALKQEKYPGSEFKGPGATQATESLSSTSNTSSTDTVLENTDVDMEHKSDHVESASIDFRASKRKFLEAAGKESKKVDRRSSFRSPQYPQGNSYMDRLKESHPWAADKMALGHGESHPRAADKMALGHGESHPWAADKKALGHGESHPQAADKMALGHGESHPQAADKMALGHGERKEVCIKGDREESKGHKGKEVHMVGGGSETPERRVEAESDTQPDDAGDERKLEFIIPGEYRSQGGVHFDGTFSQLETESSTDIVVPVTEDSVAEIDALESQEPCVKQRNDEGENTGSKMDACDDDTEDKFYDAVELSTQDKNNTLTDATLCEALYKTAYEAPPDDSGVSDKDSTLTDATLCEALYQTAYEAPPDDSGVSDKDNTLTDATLNEALYQTAYEPPPDDSGVSKFSRDTLCDDDDDDDNDDDEVFATAVGTQLASRLNHVSVSEDMDC